MQLEDCLVEVLDVQLQLQVVVEVFEVTPLQPHPMCLLSAAVEG